MKALQFWFDPVSPYACLAFEQLPRALEGLSYRVDYRPILFAGLLKQWGQKGPAEIEPKRAWTFRHVAWQARRLGIALDTPAQHPFNPLALLRLLHACARDGATPSRWQCEQVLHHVWHGGADANEARRLAELRTRLAPARDPDGDAVKQALRDATAQALARGVFGVPTIEVDGRLFWGLDSLDMLAAYLSGDAWFDGPAWDEAGAPRPGVVR
ncbi:2-hydroxychromene-2-carboxylate isomerase [Piscinibacter sp.]|uniref:2-hydroxychromene-2-carboxylate isomerase n=1 Tax=Piscinibacter sp. TaxID=1903157 RepID=UPI0039E40A65